jgi:hypothetical protein
MIADVGAHRDQMKYAKQGDQNRKDVGNFPGAEIAKPRSPDQNDKQNVHKILRKLKK